MAAPRMVARDWSVVLESTTTGESLGRLKFTEFRGREASCATAAAALRLPELPRELSGYSA